MENSIILKPRVCPLRDAVYIHALLYCGRQWPTHLVKFVWHYLFVCLFAVVAAAAAALVFHSSSYFLFAFFSHFSISPRRNDLCHTNDISQMSIVHLPSAQRLRDDVCFQYDEKEK